MNRLIGFALFAVMAALPFSAAHAGTYPDRPVTMIIPFSPGGGGDIAVRVIEKDFKEEFGQPLSFVYKPGADGAIGYSEMATLKPDGYTIGAVSYPHLLMNKLKGHFLPYSRPSAEEGRRSLQHHHLQRRPQGRSCPARRPHRRSVRHQGHGHGLHRCPQCARHMQ